MDNTSHWRGFNLIDLFSTSVRWKEFWTLNDGVVPERDFELIRDLGFTFVRLPVSYLFLGKSAFGRTPDEKRMYLVDRVIEFGQKHGVHVMLNMHRAPGYCVLAPSEFDFAERDNLFTDEAPFEAYIAWWRMFAERYRGVSQADLSFDLLNEPFNLDEATFNKVFLPAIDAIHEVDPDRYIHVEGTFQAHGSFDSNGSVTSVAMVPPTSAAVGRPNVISSMHIYHPIPMTRYDCGFGPPTDLEPPTWPYQAKVRDDAPSRKLVGDEAKLWDKEALRELLAPYLALADAGNLVHAGEMGAWGGFSHDVYIDYCRDLVEILSEHGIGFALWSLHGPFGIFDNNFADANYESYRGLKLDRKLVDVLTK
jgi:endoglucanase